VNLTSINIPDSVESIGISAFHAAGVTSIVIPDTVKNVEYQAFSTHTIIYYEGTAEQWNEIANDTENDIMRGAKRYFYSDTEPTEIGLFWHYDDDGKVIEWEIKWVN
jgi:hypothetical protein